MKGFITLSFLLLASALFAQKIYSFEEVDRFLQTEPRPILVFIHTDYCKYCLAMESKTFQSVEVQNYLDSSFYFVRLNGEEQKDITFNKHLFKYKPNGYNTGIHELVEALGTVDESISFPTVCILNSQYEIIFQHNEYIRKKTFLSILSEILK